MAAGINHKSFGERSLEGLRSLLKNVFYKTIAFFFIFELLVIFSLLQKKIEEKYPHLNLKGRLYYAKQGVPYKSDWLKAFNKVDQVIPPRRGYMLNFRGRTLSDFEVNNEQNNCSLEYSTYGSTYAISTLNSDMKCYFRNGFLIGYKPFDTDNIWIAQQIIADEIKYQYDNQQFGKSDVSLTSTDLILRKQGDCEDHAILLADWLISLGYDAKVAIGVWSTYHAWVLLFDKDNSDNVYLLEATSKNPSRILPLAKLMPDYKPNYMFNREGFWVAPKNDFTYDQSKWKRTAEFKQYQDSDEENLFQVDYHRRNNSLKKAKDIFQTIKNNQKVFYYQQAALLELEGRNYSKGLEYINKAIAIEVQNSSSLLIKGRIYYMQGSYLEAIRELEKADIINSEDADPAYYMGQSYFYLNKFAKSAEYLSRYLAKQPTDNSAQKKLLLAKKRLQH